MPEIGTNSAASIVSNFRLCTLCFSPSLPIRCANTEEDAIEVARQQQQQQHDEHVGVATAFDNLLLSNCVCNAFILPPW